MNEEYKGFPTIGQVTIRTDNNLKGIILDFDEFDSYYELCDYLDENYGYSPDECFIVKGRFQLYQPNATLKDGYERYKIVKNIAFTKSLDLLWAYYNNIKSIIEMSNEEVLEIKKWDFYPEDLDEFIYQEFKYNNKKSLDEENFRKEIEKKIKKNEIIEVDSGVLVKVKKWKWHLSLRITNHFIILNLI